MKRTLIAGAIVLLASVSAAVGGEITGKYVEARTTDIWTGPCFANAEMNLGGKQAVLGWKIETGSVGDVKLDGLSVVAVVLTSDTLGLDQSGPAKAVVLVDAQAGEAQQAALVKFAKAQSGKLLDNVIAVRSENIDLEICECKGGGCAKLRAGKASVTTRCLGHHDKVCGNESAFYPPLTKNLTVTPAMASELGYTGKELNETWKIADRRGAYIGSFATK